MVIVEPMPVTSTAIEYNVVIASGVVENVNVNPPSVELRDDDAAVDSTEKSDATPVVALTTSLTLIVQTTLNPALAGNVLVHIKLESFVGLP